MDADNVDLQSWTSDFLYSLREAEGRVSHLQSDVLKSLDDALHATLLQVRNEYNRRCSINRLPPEVLFNIFVLLSSSNVTSYDIWPVSVTDMSNILPALLVCRHWYNVMTNCATLWNSISDSRSLQCHLQRSRGAPLTLIVGVGAFALHHSILETVSPIRELLMFCTNYDLPALDTIAAPDLEALMLYDWRPKEGQTLLFQACTQRLRQLSIRRSLIPTRNSFPSLLRLCIRDVWQVSMDDLFSCLAASPNLEDLVLREFHTIDTTDYPFGLAKVHMSRLRTLTVEHLDCPRNYDIIFCRISANPSTAICVRSRSPQLVVPYSHQTADLEKLSVWHEPSRMTVVKLVGATSAICTTSEAPASRDNNLLTHVDLSRIQGVWVECDSGQGSLLPLLRRMTALTTLAVYTDKGAAVLERLTIVGDLDPPLCPNLSTLHLLVNEEGIHNGAHIHEFAVTRFRQGCPLLTVIVETMLTVDEEGILTSLESYVGEVRFKSVKRLSTMTLPAICSEKRHDFWDAAWT